MPTIIDNRFSGDTLDMRSERAGRLSANVAGLNSTLGLPPAILTQAQTASEDWETARVAAQIEQGESLSFYEIFAADFGDVAEQYQLVKDFLLALIANQPRGLVEIKTELGIDGETPTTWGSFHSRALQLIAKHAEFVTDGSPIVAPSSAITLLQTLLDTAVASHLVSQRETREARQAFDAQQELFEEHTGLFRLIFQYAKMTLGKKNPLLMDLGFTPMVQQSGGGGTLPQAPSGLHLDGETLAWTAVSGATSYSIGLSYDGGTHWESDFTTDTNSSIGFPHQNILEVVM